MKKIFLFIVIFVFFETLVANSLFSSDSFNAYMLNERTSSIPYDINWFQENKILTLEKKRNNLVLFPSVVALGKKGLFYLDLNGKEVGLFLPSSGRKMIFFFHNHYEKEETFTNFNPVLGISFSFKNKSFFGISLSYLHKEDSLGKKYITEDDDKFEQTEIYLTTSLMLLSKNFSWETGISVGFRDASETTKYEMNKTNFQLRFIYYVTKDIKWSTSTVFALGSSSSAENDNNKFPNPNELKYEYTNLNIKSGPVIKFSNIAKISSYIAFLTNYFKQNFQEKSMLNLLSGSYLDFMPLKHWTFKVGILKFINLKSSIKTIKNNKTTESLSESTNNYSTLFEDNRHFAFYLGFAYRYKNFKVETILNTQTLLKKSYALTGNPLKEDALLFSTIEYSW